jgi:starch synthase
MTAKSQAISGNLPLPANFHPGFSLSLYFRRETTVENHLSLLTVVKNRPFNLNRFLKKIMVPYWSNKEECMAKLRILIVTSELARLAGVGGIAEYTTGLAFCLLQQMSDVRVIMPGYAFLSKNSCFKEKVVLDRLIVPLGVGATEICSVREGMLPSLTGNEANLPVYLLNPHKHFTSARSSADIYSWPNAESWIAFSRAVIEWVCQSDWKPDVIICNDAMCALVPVYLHLLRERGNRSLASIRSLLVVHNLTYQATGDQQLLGFAGIPQEMFTPEYFEFYGQANCFKAGLRLADGVLTVSPAYAKEICESSDFGFGLEGDLDYLRRAGRLTGILNGIDAQSWSFKNLRYDGTDSIEEVQAAKAAVKEQLCQRWNWDVSEPIIAIRGRFDEQKGFLLVGECIEQILDRARLVICLWATENAPIKMQDELAKLERLAKERPNRLLINPPDISPIERTADHYAAADYFLMPSRFEPCGLAPMECQRFATLPIVHAVGGLKNIVSESKNDLFPSPNGFTFEQFTQASLLEAVERAIAIYHQPLRKREFLLQALNQNNDWSVRIAEYEKIFSKISATAHC